MAQDFLYIQSCFVHSLFFFSDCTMQMIPFAGAWLPTLQGEPLEALCGCRHRHTHSDDRVTLACIEVPHHQGWNKEGLSHGTLWRYFRSHCERNCKAVCLTFLNFYSLFFISINFFWPSIISYEI